MRMKKLLFSILLTMASAMAMNVSAGTYHLYVNNQTDWETFDIYAYGTYEAFGGWPGATSATTEVKNDVTYNVYEFQVEEGGSIVLNLIIHNNVGEGVAGDQRLFFTINEARDYYLEVTATTVTEVGAPKNTYHLYVNNQTGWETFDIYAYGTYEAFGGWPGATGATTEVKNDVTYNVYEFQVEEGGSIALNLIIHNNVGEGVVGDQRLFFTINEARDYYLEVTATTVTEVGAPKNTYHLYVNNQTGWETFDIYAYGTYEAFGGWPGATGATTEVKNDVTYNVYEFQVEEGGSIALNLIIHNNVGEGVAGDQRLFFTINEARDYYLMAKSNEIVELGSTISPEPIADVIVKVKKPAGWAGLSIWAWDSKDATWMAQFTAWPGVACTEIGNDWYQFTVKADAWFMFNDGQELTSVQTAAANAPTATCYTISDETNTAGHHLLVDADCATAGTPSTETVYERDVRVGYYGTICLPFSSSNITGVTLYSIAGQTEDGNGLYLDSESELQAGVPYFFLANSTKLVVIATGESTFTPNADHWYPSGNGLVGYINDGHEEQIPQNLFHYMLKNNGLYQVNATGIVRSNYAYVDWSDVPTTAAELAPGRQRRVIGAQHTTTGVDNIEQTITPTKILRDGQLLIIRDGQLFTITGQMVK